MTAPITRARKEWCEIHDPEGFAHTNVCPTYVVSALLDVLMDAYQGVDPFDGKATSGHRAVAAITRALEQKP